MVNLQEVNATNFNECISLKRENCRFVGNAESVLAEAYLYRDDSLAYAIRSNETIVGLVIVRVFPTETHPYSFTNLFIADDFQKRGYGKLAVEAIIDKFRRERRSNVVQIQVHHSNEFARKIYTQCGFIERKKSQWDNHFLVMELVL